MTVPRRILIFALVGLAATGGVVLWRDSVAHSRAKQAEARHANDRVALTAEITKLQRTIRDQEDRVEDHGKMVATIAKTKSMIYHEDADTKAEYDDPPLSQEEQEAEDKYSELDKEVTRLDVCLAHFLYQDEAMLMIYANELDLPDNPVKQAFPAYLEALRGREDLGVQRLDDDRPEAKAATHKVNAARTKTRAAVADLKTRLQSQHEAVEQQLKAAGDHVNRAMYCNAKIRFDAEQQILALMRGKLTTLQERQKNDLSHPQKP